MKKKFYLMMAVVMILSMVLASGAFAGSGHIDWELNGYDIYCYLNCNWTGANAGTSYAGPVGAVVVKLRYYYWDEQLIEQSKYSSKSKDAASVSTSVSLGPNDEAHYALSQFEVHSSGDWSGGIYHLEP